MNASQLHYAFEQMLATAGLSNKRMEGAMAHAFRHTYGTTLAADGAPVSAIRKLMGHSSINTSQGYIDSLAREEREVAAKNRVYDVLDKLNDEVTGLITREGVNAFTRIIGVNRSHLRKTYRAAQKGVNALPAIPGQIVHTSEGD